MIVLRRTWLMTCLAVLVSTVAWWWVAGWQIAEKQLPQTLLLTPIIWWMVVARLAKPHVWRGPVGGALVGFATQSAQDVLKIWNLYLRRGTGDGEAQATAIVSVVFYLMVGLWAMILGALIGLVVVVIQRRSDGGTGASRRVV